MEFLHSIPLFAGLMGEEQEKILQCLGAVRREYPAGSVIFQMGEPASRVGVVLEGGVQVVREEFTGERSILTELGPGELFGEAFACAGCELLPVSVVTVARSAVLLLAYRKLVTTCPSACPYHTRLMENMLGILAGKNILLNRRMGHLSKRTTRDKLLSYLCEQSAAAGGKAFTIPFSRQELADYLCVERSAMSAVLGRLRDEGVLSVDKRRFFLHEKRP